MGKALDSFSENEVIDKALLLEDEAYKRLQRLEMLAERNRVKKEARKKVTSSEKKGQKIPREIDTLGLRTKRTNLATAVAMSELLTSSRTRFFREQPAPEEPNIIGS